MADPLEIALDGHLDELKLDVALAPVSERLRSFAGRAALVVDVRAMTGYDAEARQRFVEWNAAHRSRLAAVAVVTDNALWRVVISAMGLASRQTMRAFDDLPRARAWARDAARPSG